MLLCFTNNNIFIWIWKPHRELAAENVIKEFTEGEKETRGPVEIPFQDEDNRGKKTLVLDLDETLVTSSCLEFPSADLKIKVIFKLFEADFVLLMHNLI